MIIAVAAVGMSPQVGECDNPVLSDGEVDNKLSNDKRSNSNYHIDYTRKKRRLVEKNNVGHKSPAQKKRKHLWSLIRE
jgi:hypothetical protein